MIKSIESLHKQVSGPLFDCYGANSDVVTVDAHWNEIRGLAFCPGKVVKYIYHIQNKKLVTYQMLSITQMRKNINH